MLDAIHLFFTKDKGLWAMYSDNAISDCSSYIFLTLKSDMGYLISFIAFSILARLFSMLMAMVSKGEKSVKRTRSAQIDLGVLAKKEINSLFKTEQMAS